MTETTGPTATDCLRTAHLLTGDPDAALRLVRASATRTDDPAELLRRVVRAAPARGRHSGGAGPRRLDGGERSSVEQAQDSWFALGGLPARSRAVLVLRVESALPVAEVAELLGIDDATVEAAESAGAAAVGGDLAVLLAARAQDAPSADDLAASVSAWRRRRARLRAAAAAVVVVAVLGGLTAWGVAPRSLDGVARAAPLPAPAEFAGGGKLVVQGRLDTATSREVTVTFTPSALPVTLTTSCTDTRALDRGTVDGDEAFSSGCGGSASWTDGGPFAVGRPATVTLTLTSGGGTALLAVYQRVPLSEYVFPPQPDQLAELPALGPRAGVDSRTVGATGESGFDVVVTDHRGLEVQAVAPGAVRLLVDGKQVGLAESWGWNQAGSGVFLDPEVLARAGVDVRAGDTVRVTVQASRFAVPGWTVAVSQG